MGVDTPERNCDIGVVCLELDSEVSWVASLGGGQLDLGWGAVAIFCFRDFKALRVDSQHHISRLP